MSLIQTTRKGITPVVAIVLLLMMTVAAAGGAFAWVNGLIGGTQEDVTQQARTQLEFRDLRCFTSGDVDFFIKNSGDTSLTATDVDFFLYNVSNGALIGNVRLDKPGGTQFGPGANWQDPAGGVDSVDFGPAGIAMQDGNSYRLLVEFTNENGVSVEDTCVARP